MENDVLDLSEKCSSRIGTSVIFMHCAKTGW